MTRTRWTLVIVSLLLTAGSLVAAWSLSIWPLVGAALLPWCLIAAGRWSGRFGIAAVTMGAGWLALIGLTLSAVAGLHLTLTTSIVLGGAALVGDVLLARVPLPDRGKFARSWPLWAPPFAGVAGWLVVLLVAQFLPGAARLSWAMNGDSANNILFSRVIGADGGIAVGGGENPVPLPAALIAVTAATRRGSLDPGHLLQHDITALATTWAIVVAVLVYVTGIAAAVFVPRDRPVLAAFAGAIGSLLMLTWFATGYPFDLGFLSLHIALVLVLLCWIAATAEAPPAVAIAIQLGAATLMLAIWSPVVAIPLALAAGRAIISYREGRLRDGASRVIIVLAVAQLAAYLAVVTVPTFLAQREFLAADGGVIRFSRYAIVAVVVAAAVLVVVLVRRGQARLAVLLGAFVVGLFAVLGGLVALSILQGGEPWSYYPAKFAWLLVVSAMIALGGILVRVVARLTSRGLRAGLGVAVGVAATLSFVVPPYSIEGVFDWRDPIPAILGGAYADGRGDAVALQVFEAADPDDWHIYWDSTVEAERTLNFWTMQTRAGMDDELFDLRAYAYGYVSSDLDGLCDVIRLFDEPLTVVSRRDLGDAISVRCPDVANRVTVVRG